MRRVAFLTARDLEGFVHDDHLAVEPLRRLGWEVTFVPWTDADTDWSEFEAVVPRTTWDYHEHLDAFVATLEQIEASTATLLNPLRLIRWNVHKTYLFDLERRGVPIIPTISGHHLTGSTLERLFDRLETSALIIKPTVGANSSDVFRLARSDRTGWEPVIAGYRAAAFLAQPFLPSITTDGEHSLFLFNGQPSHAIRKRPGAGDFRAQEEHGALLDPIELGPDHLELGRRTMAALEETPLYARVDGVRDVSGPLRLMELELIEPSLYLRLHPDAPARFAEALHTSIRVRRGSGPSTGRSNNSAGRATD